MLVKICGLNDLAGRDAAVAAGADLIGLNFFPASPRYVAPAQAAQLAAGVAVPKVGLFVEPEDAAIEAVLAAVPLDYIQPYTSAERARAIRARFGRPVIRPVHVAAAADLPRFTEGADMLLLEAPPPEGATRPGGNAATFDWTMLAGWKPGFPWLLAGGLTPETVAEAIRVTGAPGVDVSSGVERAKGVKDPDLIRAFIAAARAA